ncbi:hypothetical protein AMELA_G00228830 [Ameiurus melas]|uniref:C-type lectin domain-containing protein n=1 Tax=Ameiurus melas TaxID=219545 RepID=A0A7J6A0A6_AMEME|nr:hypothetical protein AMELA_G00228830 [Ameiurus melas]
MSSCSTFQEQKVRRRRRRAERRINKLTHTPREDLSLFSAPVTSMRNITGMKDEWVFVLLFSSVVCGIEAYIPHRYHFVNENKNWSEAQNYCRVKYTDLASINDMGEMKKLNYTLKKETVQKAWIGLQREGTWEMAVVSGRPNFLQRRRHLQTLE